MNTNIQSVEEYINTYPQDVQEILLKLRSIVLEIAPTASEEIKYGMLGYKTCGKPLVYFAAFKNHIGLYATPSGHTEFAKELSIYKQGKGSVQFPINQVIPYTLIKNIVQFRFEENKLKYDK
jgi:uncharacterized protein YdhG (YjbR/CyaY superfamily)